MPLLLFIGSIILIILDQLLKLYVTNNIALGSVHELIPGIVSLTNITNTGGAWSIFSGNIFFFYLVTVIAVIVIIYMLKKAKKGMIIYPIGLVLLLTGTIGNAIDRFTKQAVTDMFNLEFMNFAIFNLADIYITFGVIFLIIYLLFLDKDS
ncbi:signal peptidase II [Companilactobacillus sp. RD055328]|uniref:signal peptidase II n=1 Tax=Companilactobacillus sp. RD055328 TaxID=2916634 RepID=UPI001FC81470|nr:signal peptidase II [Companilactobacillus sp. RD055328]